MKTRILALLLIFIVNHSTAQWILHSPLPQTKNLKCIRFASSSIGFAVGDSGTIIRTIDTGNVWTVLSSGTQKNLRSVFFTDVNTGYAVGDSGLILKTINSGLTWTILVSGTSYQLNSVYFANTNLGFIVGNNGIILRTTNAGVSWSSSTNPDVVNLYSVFCYNAQFILTVGQSLSSACPVVTSYDGGITWGDCAFLEYGSTSYGIVFKPNFGFAVGVGSINYKYANPGGPPNGYSWWYGGVPVPNIERSIFFVDSLSGYVVGDGGTILYTYNSGSSWSAQWSPVPQNLNSVYFTNLQTGFIVGDNGVILKTKTSGVGIREISHDLTNVSVSPNPTEDNIIIDTRIFLTAASYSLLNLNGQEIISNIITDIKTTVEAKNLQSGIYFLKIKNKDGVVVKKIIKK